MSNLANFKEFVKQNPNLLKYVNNGEMTWQKFYEMYDIYGTNNEVWNKYLSITTAASATSTFDLINWFKNINVDSLQENINSIRRVIGVLQDLGSSNKTSSEYKPRPIYKHFED